MQLHRAVRLLVREIRHAAAIVADRGREGARARGGDPGDRATPTIADHADPADPGDQFGRGLDIGERLVQRDLLADRPPGRDVVALIAELDAALDPVEQRRRDDEVALCRIVVADRPDVAVDPEDLLRDTSPPRGSPAGSAR